jgi:hypothetical protein
MKEQQMSADNNLEKILAEKMLASEPTPAIDEMKVRENIINNPKIPEDVKARLKAQWKIKDDDQTQK